MTKSRLEAFSDGVLAIIITIMVLELRPPEEDYTLKSLLALLPTFLSYVLSFIYVGIYWNNHHHMFHLVDKINGAVLWKNLNLLFWLSLFPFTTAWMDHHYMQPLPVAIYGIVLAMAAVAYLILQKELIKAGGPDCKLARAVGTDSKGKISGILYIAGIGSSFVSTWVGIALYTIVAIIWFIPDKRIEKIYRNEED
ncbi:TMEM175 family protein [Niabella beijingensis]|uniref:TMEM175 family protein n=1 Tax=Niabella beijingensis TaxID=2872700 RepID=UPI001CC0FB7F|nr:TMEM175 family protein [Niabella beijingensis]MBZ4191682.1 TMEM175 family protein [Niabella beijingensis]